MRWECALFAIGTMSAVLSLPLCAQQRSDGRNHEASGAVTTSEGSARASNAAANSNVVPIRGVFRLPATSGATPFPGPAAAVKDTRPPGRLAPRFEFAGMYDYLNFVPGDPFAHFNTHGGSGSFTYNASRWIGLTEEVGSYQFSRNLFALTGSNQPVTGRMFSYLFGPRLNWRRFDYFVPFGEFLAGVARGGTELTGGNQQNTFALATGGGVDVVLTKNVA